MSFDGGNTIILDAKKNTALNIALAIVVECVSKFASSAVGPVQLQLEEDSAYRRIP